MKAPQFTLPAKFDIRISLQHPLTFPEGSDPEVDYPEDSEHRGTQDVSRLCFRATLHCGDKRKVLESPSFGADEAESSAAYECLRVALADVLARSVFSPDACPQFEMVGDVLTPKAKTT